MIEEQGVATVAISLIRPQTENTKPPRALWVPFELGRPFGPPSDPAFQRRVILAALRMLEEGGGPVRIEDFPDDDPRERPDPGWEPPFAGAAPVDGSTAALADAFEAELPRLAAAYEQSVKRRGRTTVGLSGLPISAAAHYLAAWLLGEAPASPVADMSAPLALRFVLDDLKAYYLEAALAPSSKPSSRQLADWLWNETAAGKAMFALRRANLDAADERLKLIASNFMVPGIRAVAAG
ncbi:MAG TPA: hypothetical protein VGP52_17500 [Stellaceae bacterium]|jgi:hypothetical protein|nr:hypothetical protein [Stellaceae bacterium]